MIMHLKIFFTHLTSSHTLETSIEDIRQIADLPPSIQLWSMEALEVIEALSRPF